MDAVVLKLQPDADGILHAGTASVPDRIGEQLFQDEVQLRNSIVAERILTAELGGFGNEGLESIQTAVENNIRIGQNCLIVPHRRRAFKRTADRVGFAPSPPANRSTLGT